MLCCALADTFTIPQGDESRPVNIGNDAEFTILEFAEAVREVVEKVQKEKGSFTKRVNIVHKEVGLRSPLGRRRASLC
jgi:UDP-glucuronate decarboxylase